LAATAAAALTQVSGLGLMLSVLLAEVLNRVSVWLPEASTHLASCLGLSSSLPRANCALPSLYCT
jgi:hypothetical protein